MTLTLEELLNINVSTGSKVASTVEQAPAVVTVLTRQDIEMRHYQSIADLLRYVVGFYVIDDYIQPNVAVRGVSGGLASESGLIKVMIDGHSMAFRPTGGNWLGAGLIPMSSVERVEIAKGPASAVYGADAFLATINVITRKGASINGASTTFQGVIPNRNTGWTADATVGGQVAGADVLASFSNVEMNFGGLPLPTNSPSRQVPEYNSANGRAGLVTQISRVGFLRAERKFGPVLISLGGYYSQADREGEFSHWSQLSRGFDRFGRDNRNRISLINAQLFLRVEYTHSERLRFVFDNVVFWGIPTKKEELDVGSDTFFVRRSIGSVGLESYFETQWTISEQFRAVGGASIMVDEEQAQTAQRYLKRPAAGLPAGSLLPLSTTPAPFLLANPGVYAQLSWNGLQPWLTLTGGARYDYHNIYKGQFSARFAALSTPLPNLTIRLLYSNAFKAPSPLLLYASPLRAGDIIGNPRLRPQRVHTIEAHGTYRIGEIATVSVGASYNILQNRAEFSRQGTNQVAQNSAQIQGISLESEFRLYWQDKIQAFAGVEYHNYSRDLGTVNYVSQLVGSEGNVFPPFIARGGIVAGLPPIPLQLSISGMYVSRRQSSDSNSLAAGGVYQLPGYGLMDVFLTFTKRSLFLAGKGTSISLGCRNCLASGAQDPGFSGFDYPIAPRVFDAQIRQEL